MPVEQTRQWLEQVVIGLDLCPFARREWLEQRIRFSLCEHSSAQLLLESVLAECRLLDRQAEIETTLLVFNQSLADFGQYLDMLALAEQLLVLEGYEGVYQIASFHPHYCFAGEPADDAAHYSNRSPWPMFHLLREQSLENAIAAYPEDIATVPERNIRLLRELGPDVMQQQLAALQQ